MNHRRKPQPTMLDLKEQLNRIEWKIGRSYQGIMESVDDLGEETMSKLTDALDFAETTAAEDAAADHAAKGLLEKLSTMIAELKEGVADPAAIARIEALANGVRERAAALSAAVVANTPAETGGSTGGIGGSTGGV